MPIGDLLDQISGGKPSAASPSALDRPKFPRANSIPAKRKPDDDLRRDVSKSSRPLPPSPAPSQRPPVTSERPSQVQRPVAGNGAKAVPASSAKPTPDPPRPSKPAVAGRAQCKSAAPSPISRAPPKKGSFAEILARGQRAQAVMGQVGRIQHKKVEKGAVKSKDESKPTTPIPSKSAAGYKGTSKNVPQGSTNGNGASKDAQGLQAARSKPSANKRAAEAETAEKKFKKAAQATTGYAGTARPKPGNPAKSKDVPRGGALLNAPRARHGSSKRSRLEDDYDEELDDFIDYDDEEDDGGPQYGYASDASSDMEAGLDELDVEEKRAELLARKEDIEQERLEKSLKAAKEDRKRRALEALRAGKRR